MSKWTEEEAEVFAFKADNSGLDHAIGYAPEHDKDFANLVVNYETHRRALAQYAKIMVAEHGIEPEYDWSFGD